MTHRAANSRVDPGLRIIAATVALMLAGVPVAGALHYALVRHATCAEHGASIHVDDAGQHQVSSADDDHPSSVSGAPTDAGHGHDHCTTCGVVHETVGAPASSARSVVADAAPAASVLRAEPFVVHAPSWAVAPKQGPPA